MLLRPPFLSLLYRAVVRLFNVVQQFQNQAAADGEEKKAARGNGKPSLPAPRIVDKSKSKKGKNKDNIIGRGKECTSDSRLISKHCVFTALQLQLIGMISLTCYEAVQLCRNHDNFL